MARPRKSNHERRRQAESFYRQGRSIDFISGYLTANPNEVRTWLREAGFVLPTLKSRRAKLTNAGHQLKMYQRADPPSAEVGALMRGWR